MMKDYLKLIIGSTLCLITSFNLYAQAPCLNGWSYRTPVIIDNSSNGETLTNYQALLTLNAQQLIADSKTQLDGSDIRFLDNDGAVLPFWIENETFNSTEAKLWVKVPDIPALSTDTIYLFYGQTSATSLSNGDLTFDLFDDFSGGSVDPSKWNTCQSTQIQVAGGNATFNSTTTETGIVTSINTVTGPIILEADITDVQEGIGFLGLINPTDGYAMAYEENGQPLMKMVNVESSASCYDLTDIAPASFVPRSASTTAGTWSFSWLNDSEQFLDWPGGTKEEITDGVFSFNNNLTVIAGNAGKNGSITTDWLRVRKYTAQEPSLSLGSEAASVTAVEATTVDRICEGDEVQLLASFVIGANYTWTGPNGYTSTDQNPIIANAATTGEGYYFVTAALDGACSSAMDSVYLTVNPLTVAGIASGVNTLCIDGNSDEVLLQNFTGDITRWESSNTGSAPWTTIQDTSSTLEYTNLIIDTYYRAVIQSGVCPEMISNEIKIQIDASTESGVVLGEASVCDQENTGLLELNNEVGTIQNWQFREDGETAWVDFPNFERRFTFDDLETTTYYRVVLKSGVCDQKFSDSVKVTVNPLPTVVFSAETVCLGDETEFEDASFVTNGATIRNYLWDFSDGSGAALEEPSHVYDESRDYNVTLRVESSDGCFDETSNTISISPLPQVDFLFDNACLDISIPFTQNVSVASGTIDTYAWSFGDPLNSISTALDTSFLYAAPGMYQVNLSAVTDNSCESNVTQTVQVYDRVSLAFEAPSVFLGETSEFVNNSSIVSGNVSYQWFFDDGQSSEQEAPKHDYAVADTFQVLLVGETAIGNCVDSLELDHIVFDQTKADFEVLAVCTYDSAQFVNLSTIPNGTLTYVWDFGDGITSVLENPAHLYASAGTYEVNLVATSNLGSTSAISKKLTINPVPSASFTTVNVCDEVIASFNNLSGIASGTFISSWDFGDVTSSADKSPDHLYAISDTFEVTLIITSNNSCTDTTSNDIIIYPRPQTNFLVDAVCDGLPSLFNDTTVIETGSISSYLWNFGDGTNSIEEDPIKQFAEFGTYSVSLETVSDQNCNRVASKTVTVYQLPEAEFTVDNKCFRESITPVNSSVSLEGQISYLWEFGDGDTSSLTSPAHNYAVPGTYIINLTTFTSLGCEDQTVSTVTIYELPTIEAAEDTSTSQGFSVEISATGAENYFWTPAEGLDDQGSSNPIATPLETTRYIVSATDENGCAGTDDLIVNVTEDFRLIPSNVITPDGNGQNDVWNVTNIETFGSAQVSVYDKNGKEIFSQQEYQNDWGGTSDTDILPDGDYFYIIQSEDFERVYKGVITILRKN